MRALYSIGGLFFIISVCIAGDFAASWDGD